MLQNGAWAMIVFTFGLNFGLRAEGPANFYPADLSKHYNKLANSWTPDRCWAVVPWGRQTYDGVPFELGGIMEVTGTDATRIGDVFAGRYTGIPVEQKGDWIHLVHGAGWKEDDGVAIAGLKLHYENGQTHDFPIRYGVHVRNWWKEPSEPSSALSDPNSKVIWSAANPEATGRAITLRLFKTSLANPHPEWAIRTLDFQTMMTRATPVLVAITVGDAGENVTNVPPDKTSIEESKQVAKAAVLVTDKETSKSIGGARLQIVVADDVRDYPFGEQSTDETGRSVIEFLDRGITQLRLKVSARGYALGRFPFKINELPPVIEIKLERGLIIGGVVRDPTGKPIAGVKVTINQPVKDEVGQTELSAVDTVATSAEGVWECACIPRAAANLNFALVHPKFIPTEYDEATPTDLEESMVTRADLLARKAVMTMKPGFAITGTVETEQGQPIARATVRFSATDAAKENAPQVVTVQTDAHGDFDLTRFTPGPARLAVFAKGYAPATVTIEVKPGLDAQRFKLKSGLEIKGRVTAGARQPDHTEPSGLLDKLASIFTTSPADLPAQPVKAAKVNVTWNELKLPWTATTDAEGRFQLDSLPSEPIRITVSKAGYADTNFRYPAAAASSTNELALALSQIFEFSGKVTDAEDGKPVPAFTLIRGQVYSFVMAGSDLEDQVNWDFSDKTPGVNGAFSAGLGRIQGYPNNLRTPANLKIKFLIQAEGYLPDISPAFDLTGWHQYDFKLRKGRGPHGVILDPDGQPLAGASVAMLGVGYPSLGKATVTDLQRGQSAAKTDPQGAFQLPALIPSPSLVVVHAVGIAEVSAAQLQTNQMIRLQKWGRVEGLAKAGTKPWANQEIILTETQVRARNRLNYDMTVYKATTDAAGHFTLENIPPGERQPVRLIKTTERSWMHSDITPFAVKAGETMQVTMGGVGRPVIGKVALSDPNRQVDFNSGFHSFSTRLPRPPAEYRTAEKIREWQKGPEFQLAMKQQRSYGLKLSEDGSFRIENVRPGTYDLRIQLNEPSPQRYQFGNTIGSYNQQVIVPEIPGGVSDEPLDLGVLPIQLR